MIFLLLLAQPLFLFMLTTTMTENRYPLLSFLIVMLIAISSQNYDFLLSSHIQVAAINKQINKALCILPSV